MVDTSNLSRPISLQPARPVALPPTDPSIRSFGAYELLQHVGRGGMAEVWLARRSVMPGGLKPCALKIIHRRVADKPRYQRMFLQEARLALKLRHANLVSVFDAGEVDGRLYMALEWVDGVDLRSFTQHAQARLGVLPVPVVCHIVAELLQGLRHAHRLSVGGRPLGVIHRDIAPHNILVSAAGEVKLADFGIARVAGELSSGMYIKGRARYMAPEQLRGETTQASDLFAIGAIVHELLSGRRFREDLRHRHDWHQVIARASLPPLSRRDVPPALEALRVGLLQADPTRRIATADDALGWLMRCPPWPPGALALRAMYQHCVGAPRRTGLTHSEPHSIDRISRDLASTTEPTVPRIAAAPRSTPTLPRRSDADGEAPSPSWTPSPSASRPTVPTEAGDLALRRRSLPAKRPRRSRRHHALRWVTHGLWTLSALLALIAAGLGLAPAPGDLPACMAEPSISADRWARIRLRGDGRPRAEVRIDMQVLGVAARAECWVSPGTHEFAWRSSPQEPWHTVGPRTLISAKEHLLRVGEDGLAISAYDP